MKLNSIKFYNYYNEFKQPSLKYFAYLPCISLWVTSCSWSTMPWGLPNLIASLRFVCLGCGKRDSRVWGLQRSVAQPPFDLDVSAPRDSQLSALRSPLLVPHKIFACRISLLIGYMTCQLTWIPECKTRLTFLSPAHTRSLHSLCCLLSIFCTQFQQLLLLGSLGRCCLAPFDSDFHSFSFWLFFLFRVLVDFSFADCFVKLVMSWFKPPLLAAAAPAASVKRSSISFASVTSSTKFLTAAVVDYIN